MDGWEAVVLWKRYRRGDEAALARLLHYNAEDVDGLALIHGYLAERNLLPDRYLANPTRPARRTPRRTIYPERT
jgi:hypothetical protein